MLTRVRAGTQLGASDWITLRAEVAREGVGIGELRELLASLASQLKAAMLNARTLSLERSLQFSPKTHLCPHVTWLQSSLQSWILLRSALSRMQAPQDMRLPALSWDPRAVLRGNTSLNWMSKWNRIARKFTQQASDFFFFSEVTF